MRIIRLKLHPDVKELLRDIAGNYRHPDPELLEDMYALMRFKGSGIPDKPRVALMAKKFAAKQKIKDEMGIRYLIGKRVILFNQLKAQVYFAALCQSKDPIKAVERMLQTYQTMHQKTRQSQCMTCKLRPNCDFGKQYAEVIRDITATVDPDYEKKAHVDCPHLPEIGAFNQFFAGLNAHQNMVQSGQAGNSGATEAIDATHAQDNRDGKLSTSIGLADDFNAYAMGDMDSGDQDDDLDFNVGPPTGEPGKVPGYRGKFTDSHIIQITEAMVKKLVAADLLIYELGRKLSLALSQNSKINFKPVNRVARDKKVDTIKSHSELPHVLPSQHALPDAVFDEKLRKKSLVKSQFQAPEDKKQLLYLLIDSSGSMGGLLGHNRNSGQGLMSRGSLATVLALALTKKVMDDKGIIRVRFFSGGPGPLMKAHDENSFSVIRTMIGKNSYNGGGTDILKAIKTAGDDIDAAAQDIELASSEILCITDCEDDFDVPKVKAAVGKRIVSILDVSGGKGENAQLKAVSDKYYKADPNFLDADKMVSLVAK